jgi:hypothetical protein
MLPKDMLKVIPKDLFDTETGTLRILHEEEWRSLGITQVSFLFYSVDGRVLDGHIMRFMFRNRIFFCSSWIPLRMSTDVLGETKIINKSSVEKEMRDGDAEEVA